MNIIELKTLLKDNKINFCSYWDKKTICYRRQRLRRKKVRTLSMID